MNFRLPMHKVSGKEGNEWQELRVSAGQQSNIVIEVSN